MLTLNFDLFSERQLQRALVMSILRYFKKTDEPSHPLLPKLQSRAEESANIAVVTSMEATLQRKGRGSYKYYDPDLRAKIGRYAVENGNKAAVSRFSTELGQVIPKSTVRGMKSNYICVLEKAKDQVEVRQLPLQLRGCPLKLWNYDGMVKEYIHALRCTGGIVNRSIVVVAATGILEHLDPSRLSQNGGDITVETTWAKSFLSRIGFVHRKGTKVARKLHRDFENVKSAFLDRIRETATTDTGSFVPPQLILNFDQTNAKFVLVSEWTLEKSGTKQVSIIGLEDN